MGSEIDQVGELVDQELDEVIDKGIRIANEELLQKIRRGRSINEVAREFVERTWSEPQVPAKAQTKVEVQLLLETSPETKCSPRGIQNALSGYVTWFSEDDRPVSGTEFVSRNFPDRAKELDLEVSEGPFFTRPSSLEAEDRVKLTMAILEKDQDHSGAFAFGGEVYDNGKMIEAIRTQILQGPSFVESAIREREFFLSLIERGKLIIDPNEPDIDINAGAPPLPF